MKRISFLTLAAVVAAMTISSCKKQAESGEQNDSTAAKSELAEGEVPDEEMEGNNNFYSPDLMMDELKGIVTKCTTRSTNCDENGVPDQDAYWTTITKVYDKDGMLDFGSKEMNWRLNNPRGERNAKGQLTKVLWYVEDYDTDIYDEYTYNADGTIKSCYSLGIESDDEIKYFYDDNFNLIKTTSEGAGEGSIFRSTMTYRILESDDEGNWTRRVVHQHFEDGEDDGSNKYTNEIYDYTVEERTITYRK